MAVILNGTDWGSNWRSNYDANLCRLLDSLKSMKKFLSKVEEVFLCICCQEVVFQPVTTECQHNVCRECLQRSFKAEVYTCPACRHDLGKNNPMKVNKPLQAILSQFFPGYSSGR